MTAEKAGVPLPETCKEFLLDKNFMIFYNGDGNDYPTTIFLWRRIKGINLVGDWLEWKLIYNDRRIGGHEYHLWDLLPSPQMHEIARLLPPFSNCSYQTIYQICILVENRNIAQAAAELYLQLKSQNLLCQ